MTQGGSINYPFTRCIIRWTGVLQPRREKMCLCVKNQVEAEKVCQPVTQGRAQTRGLQASAGQVATEALSVITDKS